MKSREWVKLLTNFDGHPKILGAGLGGAGLYSRALAYVGRYETDGFVPDWWIANALANDKQMPKRLLKQLPDLLVEQGLWEKVKDGYQIGDFTEVNRSRSEMESLRETRSIAGKRGGTASKRSSNPSVSVSSSPSSSRDKALNALDAKRGDGKLSHLLAAAVHQNGLERPEITDDWLIEEARLLEEDRRDPAECGRLIRWSADNEFWRSIIVTPAKLRKHFDQIQLQSRRGRGGMDQAHDFADEARRLRDEEQGAAP